LSGKKYFALPAISLTEIGALRRLLVNHIFNFFMLFGIVGGAKFLMAQGGHVHVHGKAELYLALDSDKILAIEFKAPAADIFGFESLGGGKLRAEKLEKQVALLKKPEQFLQVAANLNCKYQYLKINAFGRDLLQSQQSGKAHEHAVAHNHKHDHHSKDQKTSPHAHHHADHGEHSDLVASYAITCEKPLAGQKIELKIIEKFPSIKDLSVVLLGEKDQKKWSVREARFEFKL